MKQKIKKLLNSTDINDIKIGLILLSKNLPEDIGDGYLDYTLGLNGALSFGYLFKGLSLHLGNNRVIYSTEKLNHYYYNTIKSLVKSKTNFEKYE